MVDWLPVDDVLTAAVVGAVVAVVVVGGAVELLVVAGVAEVVLVELAAVKPDWFTKAAETAEMLLICMSASPQRSDGTYD